MGPNAAGTMPAPTTVEISFEFRFRVGAKWDILTLHDKRQQTKQGKDKALVPVRPILYSDKGLYQHITVQIYEYTIRYVYNIPMDHLCGRWAAAPEANPAYRA